MFTKSAVLAILASTCLSAAASAQGAWHQYSQSAEQFIQQKDYVHAQEDCLNSLKQLDKDDPRYALSTLQLSRIFVATGNTLKATKVLAYGLQLCRSRRPVCLDVYCELLQAQASLYKQMNEPELARLAQQELNYVRPPVEAPPKKVVATRHNPVTPSRVNTPLGRADSASASDKEALAELDERVRQMWKEQRDEEKRERQQREEEERRIATQQQRAYEQQLSATRDFESRELAAQIEREKIAASASASHRESTVPLNTMSWPEQMAAAEAYSMAQHRSLPLMSPVKGLGFYTVGNESHSGKR
jgi:hypothetical protein